jgi:lipid II:glycine glycyltransferase (peptidoglycan interpeptide bridge formation enzyme)
MHYLNLEKGSDELYRRFRKKGVQYCIKKAAKSGVVFSRSVDLTGLMTFYDLHLMTRKKLGVPTQPKRYFRKLFQDIINRGMGFVMLAYFDGRAIAGGVFLHYKKNLIYKYGASDPDYVHLYGNHGLLWEVIQWGCRNGFHVLDWGRTDEKNEGLRNFKLGWGTEEKRLSYSYIGEPPKDYSTGWKQRMVENTIRKSPVWVGRLLGAGLYKHVG